jgi:hypothetical protein
LYGPDGGNTVLFGINSWGVTSNGNTLASYPYVTTRVASYVDWIKANTPPASPESCAKLLQPRNDLSGTAQNQAYQADIARYCSMPGTSTCITKLVGRANADSYANSVRLLGNTETPAQYISVQRDRYRKLQAAEKNPAVASALCAGPDSDGDWVVDANDKCANTPSLTATDDNGCPTPLPPGPSSADVQTVLKHLNLAINPLCNGSPPPPQTAGVAIYQTFHPNNGLYIVSSAVLNQQPGCPVWYNFEVQEMSASGPVGSLLHVVFKDTEAMNPVGGLSGEPNVPTKLVQFHASPTDPGTRGTLGGIPLTNVGVTFRVQAVNGQGQRGPWSEWKTPTDADCRALGVVCGHR